MSHDVESSLWNRRGVAQLSHEGAARDFDALLEQYKLYVELTDRLSERRLSTNRYFLTLNAVLFSAVGVIVREPVGRQSWLAVYALTLALLQCLVWYRTVRSYRQAAAAKFEVIEAFEQRLPASPWTRAEWVRLGRGKEPRKYRPLASLEQWVPVIFALAYIGLFLSSGALNEGVFTIPGL